MEKHIRAKNEREGGERKERESIEILGLPVLQHKHRFYCKRPLQNKENMEP